MAAEPYEPPNYEAELPIPVEPEGGDVASSTASLRTTIHDLGDVEDDVPQSFSAKAQMFVELMEKSPRWSLMLRDEREKARRAKNRINSQCQYYVDRYAPWLMVQTRFRIAKENPPGWYDLWVRIVEQPDQDKARRRMIACGFDPVTRQRVVELGTEERRRRIQAMNREVSP